MTGDTLKKSSTEQIVQMIAGYLAGVAVNYLVLPRFGNFEHAELWSISLIFTVISYFRGLFIRRAFNKLPHDWTFARLFKR